jgi:hypothetical protein
VSQLDNPAWSKVSHQARRKYDDMAVGPVHSKGVGGVTAPVSTSIFNTPQNTSLVFPVPNIYPLVELKTNYDRYVLVISTKEKAHILEVSIR